MICFPECFADYFDPTECCGAISLRARKAAGRVMQIMLETNDPAATISYRASPRMPHAKRSLLTVASICPPLRYTELPMRVVIGMLRGVNVGGHNKIKMDALRAVCESLKLRDAQTYVQSGNVVFKTDERDLERLSKRLEDALQKKFGFRPSVILRTAAELRTAIGKNPFAKRRGIAPNKLLVLFLADDPGDAAREILAKLNAGREEVRIESREIYIYFPNGMGQSKLPWSTLHKGLNTTGTGRNWNSVTKLLEMAEALEAAG